MKKQLMLAGTLVVVAILFVTGRTLWASGIAKKIEPHQNGDFRLVKGMAGAEDLTIDPVTGIALVSSFDRRKKMEGQRVKGAIYALDFKAPEPKIRELTANFNQPDFAPHGISLYIDPVDRSKWLFVINHRDSGHFVEIFEWQDSALVHRKTVESEHFLSPNDIVGTGKLQFYFTNDHNSKGTMAYVKDFLMIGSGQVGYFDGEQVEILDKGIPYANGINITGDGMYVLVAATVGRKINVYQRQPFQKVAEIRCGTGVDNIEIDGLGNLWVGAHPKMLAFMGHARSAEKRSPSQVLKIAFHNASAPARIEEIYLNNGDPLSGVSVAAMQKGYLLLGSVFDDGVLVGKIKDH